MAIIIQKLLIDEVCLLYLRDRRLISQYKKAKDCILDGKLQNVDLKLREPKEKWVWYFRINKQYRAYCTYRDNALRIYEINDHSR